MENRALCQLPLIQLGALQCGWGQAAEGNPPGVCTGCCQVLPVFNTLPRGSFRIQEPHLSQTHQTQGLSSF